MSGLFNPRSCKHGSVLQLGCCSTGNVFPASVAMMDGLSRFVAESSCSFWVVVRAWVYSSAAIQRPHQTEDRGNSGFIGHLAGFSGVLGPLPSTLPNFLKAMEHEFLLAGLQMRILNTMEAMQPLCKRWREIAQAATAEAGTLISAGAMNAGMRS